jgi:hypothetical protein
VALQERNRTNGLAAVQDASDQDALGNQDALALAVARSNRQYAIDYVLADIAHEQAYTDATLKHSNNEIDDTTEQQRLRNADYAWTTAKDLADFKWRDRAAHAERDFAKTEAARQAADLTPQTSGVPSESGLEETYSEQVALAQRTEDLALAGAERQDMLDQTTADNTQRQSDAAANAAFLTAQYAAKVQAMQPLVSDLGQAPWALYQQARAVAEQAAWNSPLKADYLAWQQQVSAVYVTYASARAVAYFSSATDIANRTNTDAQYSAGRTAQEVAALAGDELAFEQHLADRVFTYREAMALADQEEADGRAAATREFTSCDAGPVPSERGAADVAYKTAYVQFDGQRRHDMATEGLNFVRDLAGAAATAVNPGPLNARGAIPDAASVCHGVAPRGAGWLAD